MLTPGPLQVSPAVWKAAWEYQLNHRSDTVRESLIKIQKNLKKILKLSNNYRIIFFNSSGRGAVEAALSPFLPQKKSLVLVNGAWGNYMARIARCYDPKCGVAFFNQNKPINLEKLGKIIRQKKPQVIFFVAHETEQGLLNNVAKIAKLAKKYNCMLVVDAMSAVVVENIDYERLGIDLIIFNSTKALRSIGPIGMVAIKKSALKKIQASKNSYLNLYAEALCQNANVLPTNSLSPYAVMSLLKSTTELLKEGVQHRRRDILKKMSILKSWAVKKKLKFLIDPNFLGNFTLPLYLPLPWKYPNFHKQLQKKGFFVRYSLLGEQGNTFEVCPVGYLSKKNIYDFIKAVNNILSL